MNPQRLVPALVAALLILNAPARADTIAVPGDAPTVAAALQLAAHGDTVLLAPGVYAEHSMLLVSGVSLSGTGATPADVVIDAEFWGRHFEGSDLDSLTRLENLTLKNGFSGYQRAGAVDLINSEPRFRDVVFENNAAYQDGGAVFCYTSHPVFERVEFLGNSAYGYCGGAVYCHSYSRPLFIDARFDGNQAESGGGVYLSYSDARFADVVFSGNSASSAGGGIFVASGSAPTVDHALFVENASGCEGGAVACYSNATFTHATFWRNTAIELGGGMACRYYSPDLGSSTFCDNAAGTHGGAVFCQASSPWLNRVILAFSASGEGIYGENNAEPVLACCDVFGNAGGDFGGSANNQIGMVGNISADPLFCSAAAGDLTIDEASPCAPANHPCGLLVGAHPVACSVPTPVRGISWGAIKAMYR